MSNNNIRIHYIYLITNNLDGRNYVGQRWCPKDKTPWTDKEYMGSGKELYYDKEAFGIKNFSKDILAICYSKKEANILERQYIKLYREIGKAEYNISDGGNGGYLGEQWRQNISDSMKKLYNSPRGKIVRQKIREKRKLQAPLTKEQQEQRLQHVADFWNSPEGQKQKQINSEKQKGSHTTKGKHWYNNGIKNVQAFECPKGYVPGRLGDFTCSEEAKQKKSEWYKNLTEEQRKEYKQHLSESHKGKHFTVEQKKHIGDGNRGRKYYNNGIIEVMQFEQPEGFVPGRLPSIKEKISKGSKKAKNS